MPDDTTDTYDDDALDSEPAADITISGLRRLNREPLNELAREEYGLDPDEYPNKEGLIEAIMAAETGDDGQRVESAGRLKHTGAWRVVVPILYLSTAGKTQRAGLWALDSEGNLVKDPKGNPIQNVIDDIPFKAADRAYRRGRLEPVMA
jgi:hypothetical protein